ncbi:serine hydrolase [Maribacter sp. 2210JD10-5]|uniref:serine hydrolase n=1 Tax=Maribacter sp. 2210JD10-5 TaxID=3386272 RepID=UPI0039BC2D57
MAQIKNYSKVFKNNSFAYTLTLLIYFLGSMGDSHAQEIISEEIQKTIGTRIDNGVNTGIVIGVIDGENVSYYSYGARSLNGNEPVNEKSVFEIGSISKTFTGLLLADMVLKNEVKLDDELQKYLPQGITAPVQNGETIKLVHLANHTSSLPRMPDNFSPSNPDNPFSDYSKERLYEFLNGYEPHRDIGSEYEYSNYGVGLLGHVLASRKGKSYEELLLERISKPLGLKETKITLSPKMRRKLAVGHSMGVEVSNWDFETLAGAGAIRSTAMDMVQFLKFNMGVDDSPLDEAMRLSHTNSRKEGAKPMVGLGWHLISADNDEVVWHNGGTGGYSTFIGFIKDGKKGVVVLSNSNASIDDIGLHLLNSKSPLKEVKPSIVIKIKKTIDAEGIEKAVATYWDLKNNNAEDYNFSENELENLAYSYFTSDKLKEALALTKLNTEAHPTSSSAFASYADVLLKQGDSLKAIENYKKAIVIHPDNQRAIKQLEELGINTETQVGDIKIDNSILESYVGRYELAPSFILSVRKDGNQIKAQATGQPEFPIYPKSENVFFLKVVEAQLTFNTDENGEVASVTLLQGGQEITGKRIENN